MSAFSPAWAKAAAPAWRSVWGAGLSLSGAIAALFRSSEQGAWYDPSDMTTLFQDSAGTTPVTSMEQPVGKMLDKSGRGNHATQPTAINRPVLSSRVNLVSPSADFSGAAWIKTNIGPVAGTVVAPDGSACGAYGSTDPSNLLKRLRFNIGATATGAYTWSIYIKAGTEDSCAVNVQDGSGANGAVMTVRLADGVIVSGPTIYGTATSPTATVQAVGNGFYRISISANLVSALTQIQAILTWDTNGSSLTTGTLFPWGAQIETGSTATRYQRVNTSTDYDSVGFPSYLKFNGTNSWMSTASIDFSGTDKMTVVAGVRKLSDAASNGTIMELGDTSVATVGEMYLRASSGGLANYQAVFYGSSSSATQTPVIAAPNTSVISMLTDLGGNTFALYVNGGRTAANGISQTLGGTFQAVPVYIGARAGPSLFFNGQMYGMVIRGALSSDAQITSAETYVNSKTGAY